MTAKKQSMQSAAYDFIKQKITTCEYAPNQMLSESLLQAELGFSRTPVREAISRLAQEGLLKVFPKRGIIVSGFTFSDINMIFEVRTLVEPYTLLNYGIKLNLDEISHFSKRLQDECASSFDSSFYQVDDKFHSMLMAVLPNVYLRELYNRIQTQNIRLQPHPNAEYPAAHHERTAHRKPSGGIQRRASANPVRLPDAGLAGRRAGNDAASAAVEGSLAGCADAGGCQRADHLDQSLIMQHNTTERTLKGNVKPF